MNILTYAIDYNCDGFSSNQDEDFKNISNIIDLSDVNFIDIYGMSILSMITYQIYKVI